MRAKNTTGSVTEHFHSTAAKDEGLYALLESGQTMKDLPEEYQHGSFKRRAFRRVMDGTPSEKRGVRLQALKGCMEACKASPSQDRRHGNLFIHTKTGL